MSEVFKNFKNSHFENDCSNEAIIKYLIFKKLTEKNKIEVLFNNIRFELDDDYLYELDIKWFFEKGYSTFF